MGEEDLCLGAYLLGRHLIKAAQQLAKGPLVAEYGVHARAGSSGSPGLRRRAPFSHPTLGSGQLLLTNAVGGDLNERRPHQLQNLG